MDDNLGFWGPKTPQKFNVNGASVGPYQPRPSACRENIKFRTILELGLGETYPGGGPADLAYGAGTFLGVQEIFTTVDPYEKYFLGMLSDP